MIAAPDFPRLVARINSMRDAGANRPDIEVAMMNSIKSPSAALEEEVERLLRLQPDAAAAVAALIDGSREPYYANRPALTAAIGCELRKIVGTNRSADDDAEPPTSSATAPRRPLPPRLPPFVAFPVDALPEKVASAVTAHAAAIGCDPCMVALPMLAGLAASIGNSRRVRLKLTWDEPAIIWAVVVGQSGDCKSPPFDAALEPLRKMQRIAFDNYRVALDSYSIDMKRHAADAADWKKSGDRETDPPIPPVKPTCWRILVEDTTTEALAPILLENPRGLLLARDELSGFLRGFDQYRAGKGGDAARWLQLHRAGELMVDRKTGEGTIFVANASVSVTGTIQPEILRTSLGYEGFVSGLAARMLLAMPPRRVQVWNENVVEPKVSENVERIYARLLSLAPADNGTPVLVDLTPSAKEAWKQFYNDLNQELATLTGDLAAAWKKLEAYCARFALVIALARAASDDRDGSMRPETFIDEPDMVAAVTITRWFMHEGERVYAVLAESPAQSEDRELVELIARRGGSITARDLRRGKRRFRTTEAAAAALAALVQAGHGAWSSVETGVEGGRPTRTFRLRDADETPGVSSAAGSTGGKPDMSPTAEVDLD